MKTKKLLSMLLALCLLLTLLPAAVSAAEVDSGSCGDNVGWSLSSDGTLTISGTGNMDDFDWNNHRPGWYNHQDSIIRVVIEEGVTNIGEQAFQGYANLTSVTIPGSVSDIEFNALLNCHSLTGIWVDPSNTNYSSDVSGVLFNKAQTELIVAPAGFEGSYVIPNGTVTVGDYAFYQCYGLTDVTIPDSVTSIGGRAFYRCTGLTYAVIPASVTSIGEYAFYNSGLESVMFLGSAPSLADTAFNRFGGAIEFYYPAGDDTWNSYIENYPVWCYWRVYYTVLEGANGVMTCKDLTVKINGVIRNVEVCGWPVSEEYYTITEDGTTVTLKSDFLDSAPDGFPAEEFYEYYGFYPLDLLCDDGSASTTFTMGVTDHDYAAATCTAPKTCKACGATEGTALGHSFTNYVSNNDATCTKDGTKTAKCDRCEATDTVTDLAKGHDYAAATCTAPKTCKVCGATEGTALGHSFTNYVSNNEATCTKDGTKTAKCDRCDATDTVADPAKGHDYAAATCTAPKTCKVCNATEGAALGHSFTNYVSNNDATCTKDGTKTAKCDRCDATDTVADAGSAKGHDYAAATCTAPKTCKACGETEGTTIAHADANADNKCDMCGTVLKEEQPTDPAPTDPAPTDPAPTDPVPTEPKPTEPEATEPKPTEPEPTVPEAEGPQTGDTMDFLPWIALLMLSAAGIVLCLILLERKRRAVR